MPREGDEGASPSQGPSSGGPSQGPGGRGWRRRGRNQGALEQTSQLPPREPGANAERVPVGMTQRFARPDDDYVPPARQEPQLEHIRTDSIDVPSPLPPPLTVTKSPPSTKTIPGSLPANARLPKHGHRADAQRMSQSSSSGENPGLLSGLASRLPSWLAPSTNSPPRNENPSAYSGWSTAHSGYATAASAPPTPKQARPTHAWHFSQHHVPSMPPPPTHTVQYSIHTPSPHNDMPMGKEEEEKEPHTVEPESRSIPSFPKAAESSLWDSSPFRRVPVAPDISEARPSGESILCRRKRWSRRSWR